MKAPFQFSLREICLLVLLVCCIVGLVVKEVQCRNLEAKLNRLTEASGELDLAENETGAVLSNRSWSLDKQTFQWRIRTQEGTGVRFVLNFNRRNVALTRQSRGGDIVFSGDIWVRAKIVTEAKGLPYLFLEIAESRESVSSANFEYSLAVFGWKNGPMSTAQTPRIGVRESCRESRNTIELLRCNSGDQVLTLEARFVEDQRPAPSSEEKLPPL